MTKVSYNGAFNEYIEHVVCHKAVNGGLDFSRR